MRTLFCNLLSVLLLSVSLFYLHIPTDKEETITLHEVNVISQPHINSIIKRIVGETRKNTTDSVYYLTARLENDSCGIRMKIVAHVKKNLSWFKGYSGYTKIDDLPIVFVNNSQIELEYIPGRLGIFPMASRHDPPIIYDPDVGLFILKDNGYYRYFEGRGWVWFEYDCR